MQIEKMLLRKDDVCRIFNLPETKTISILSRHGIRPLDFGKGRGGGLRWYRSDVMAVLDTLHAETQAKSGVPKRRSRAKMPGVTGRSPNELYLEFNREGAVLQ